MFQYEKEMIPILKKNISSKYKNIYFTEEFKSWNWVADLVYSINLKKKNWANRVHYNYIYFMLNYLNIQNKKIGLLDLEQKTWLKSKDFKKFIDFLLNEWYIDIKDVFIKVKKKYQLPSIDKLISIEAKLSDWKWWFYQALRYKCYSHKSYLAISEEYAHRVDLSLFVNNNVWLMVVNNNDVRVLFEPTIEDPKDKIIYWYLSEIFYDNIFFS
jgi:hypothetical protein